MRESTSTMTEPMSHDDQRRQPAVWPTLSYHDAPAAIRFLTEVFGFVATAVYPDESNPSSIMHAQLDWPAGGGIMLGSAPRPEGWTDPAGHGSVYVVTATRDDVDRIFARAVAAGATPVREPADQDYGGRNCVVVDLEGNHWSFGDYAGEPRR